MKKIISVISLFAFAALFIVACSKARVENNDEISQDVLDKISALGFSTNDVINYNGGYLVEGDIFLSAKNLNESPGTPEMLIANEEHYHTFNLVTGTPRTITVSLNTTASYFVNATNEAIARYNAQNLALNFQLVSGNADINIVTFYEQSTTIGSGGFPTSSGDPHNQIRLNTYYFTPSAAIPYLATVIAHEIGHCIGFRHTDYMSRRYSCGNGGGGNEGQVKIGVGAVHIPGTPTGPDPNSWMLACIGNGISRPFTTNDLIALNYVY